MPLVQRLRALSSACDRSGGITIVELALRQQITDAVVVANTAPATDPRIHVSWREELIAEWVKAGRIGPPDAPGSQKKIDLLTSRIAEHKRLPIDVLTDRTLMLVDLSARVALLNRDLGALLRAVTQLPATVPAKQ